VVVVPGASYPSRHLSSDGEGTLMAVLVRMTVAGIDAAGYDRITEAAKELMETLKKQPGFIMHVAYPVSDGFVVGEVWDSLEQQRQWMNDYVTTNVPVASEIQEEVFEIHNLARP
jgi:hypothetical protein